MPKVKFSAPWWRTIRRWMDSFFAPRSLRTLIRAHAAEALEKARRNKGFIDFEQRALLFGDFRLCHPGVEVDFSLYSAELNYALGRPYFLIRTAR